MLMPTFQLLHEYVGLMVTVVDNGGRTWGVETVLLQSLSMPHLPGQHPLLTLVLVLIVTSLGVVHVEPPCVWFIIFVFYFHPVTCSQK